MIPPSDPPESNAPAPEEASRDDILVAVKAAAILGAGLAAGAVVISGPKAGGSVVLGAAVAIANLLGLRAIIRSVFRAPTAEELAGDAAAEGRAADPDGKAPPPQSAAEAAAHREAGRKGGWAWGVFAILKIFLLFGGMWLLLTRGWVDPIPLVVGYGVLPLGITVGTLWTSLRGSRR